MRYSPYIRDTLIRTAGGLLGRLFPSTAPIESASPKSIAIVKPCCLGDVLMATSILRPLRERYPQAKLAFGVGDWSREAVANNPDVDELLRCDLLAGGDHRSFGEYLSTLRRLRKGRYDWCIVLERSVWLALLPFLAGIPVRAGLDSEGRGFSLNVRASCEGIKHEAERYLDCIRALGIPVNSPALAFHPTASDRERARALLPAARPDSPLVAIHPGGGANPGMTLSAKRWLPERFAAVANLLVEERGATIVLLGAANESSLTGQVRESMSVPPIDLTGKLTLGEMGGVLGLCQLFIGNDTGPMHLATAVGTPVVAIFGPSDPRVYGPYSSRGAVVSAGLPCSPCFARGRAPDCRDIRCMREVGVEQVWTAVQQRLRPQIAL